MRHDSCLQGACWKDVKLDLQHEQQLRNTRGAEVHHMLESVEQRVMITWTICFKIAKALSENFKKDFIYFIIIIFIIFIYIIFNLYIYLYNIYLFVCLIYL